MLLRLSLIQHLAEWLDVMILMLVYYHSLFGLPFDILKILIIFIFGALII